MTRYLISNRVSRRRFFELLLVASSSLSLGGCATFKSKKNRKEVSEFEEDEENKEEPNEQSVFESEREKQSELSKYVAKTAKTEKKKKIKSGDTFLLSDKAKEIYANTER